MIYEQALGKECVNQCGSKIGKFEVRVRVRVRVRVKVRLLGLKLGYS